MFLKKFINNNIVRGSIRYIVLPILYSTSTKDIVNTGQNTFYEKAEKIVNFLLLF